MGTSFIALGRCNEAVKILREGSKLDGHGLRDRTAHDSARMSMLVQLGQVYAEQGKLQRALAVYREALHSLPRNYPPQVSLSFNWQAHNLDDFDNSNNDTKLLCDLQSIYHRLGDTLARMNQWSEAERFHQAALEVQPDHVATHVSYGTMLARNVSFQNDIFSQSMAQMFTLFFRFNYRVVEQRKLNYGLNERWN